MKNFTMKIVERELREPESILLPQRLENGIPLKQPKKYEIRNT
jgi:hypothetical protein